MEYKDGYEGIRSMRCKETIFYFLLLAGLVNADTENPYIFTRVA